MHSTRVHTPGQCGNKIVSHCIEVLPRNSVRHDGTDLSLTSQPVTEAQPPPRPPFNLQSFHFGCHQFRFQHIIVAVSFCWLLIVECPVMVSTPGELACPCGVVWVVHRSLLSIVHAKGVDPPAWPTVFNAVDARVLLGVSVSVARLYISIHLDSRITRLAGRVTHTPSLESSSLNLR